MYRKITLLFVLAIAFTTLQSQSLRKLANTNYYDGNYIYTIDIIKELLKKTPTDNDLKLKLADCYLKLEMNIEAEALYEELIKLPKLTPYHVLNYAKVLAKNENYLLSAEIYKQLTALTPSDSRGPAFYDAYTNLQKFYQDKERIHLYYTSINTNQSDFAPTYYNNGIVFLSARSTRGVLKKVFGRDNTPFLDYFYMKDTAKILVQQLKQDGTIKSESNKKISKSTDDNTAYSANDNATSGSFGNTFLNNLQEIPVIENTPALDFSEALNSPVHEGPLTFNSTFDTVYFTRNAVLPKSVTKKKRKFSRLFLYTASLIDGKWQYIKPFEFNNPDFAMGHPALTPDGKKLYFVSDMPGGVGGTDIYFCRKVGGQWLKPENAGNKINSEGNEMFPFVDGENHLFYCTDGKPGLGGQDIYVAWLDDVNKEPKNIGMPVNSCYDDFALIYDSKSYTGYFSSNRKRGMNDDDIFKFTTSPYSNAIINVSFTSKKDNKPIEGITLSCLNERQINSFKKNSNSSYTFNVKPNTYNFLAYQETADTAHFSITISNTSKDPFETQIIDTTIAITFSSDTAKSDLLYNILNPIFYNDDNAYISAPQQTSLPQAVKMLKDNPKSKLKITSYGNVIKDKVLSKKVALNRAKAIKSYVTNFGIEPRRLILEWFEAKGTDDKTISNQSQRSDLEIVIIK